MTYLTVVQLKDHDPSDPPVARMPSDAQDYDTFVQHRLNEQAIRTSRDELARSREILVSDGDSHTLNTQPPDSPPATSGQNHNQKEKEKERRSAKGPKPFDQAEREEMEHVLHELRGHLGIFQLCYRRLRVRANTSATWQLSTLLVSWRARTFPTTSSSRQTGKSVHGST